ncbi:SAM-dependent methyltransferase (plasmid) [Azospirillum argentinense]|uniref:SAM-dependent methyltransferase n=1 Tax=Azospirillum argentinense TaxID=2970906 RepID=A0A4D8PYD9_9PROT|nr:methyltransferase [Azospirillum argentinense]QCO00486.1 SAM-dependent methyltransferase [Azospirillum argentinense]
MKMKTVTVPPEVATVLGQATVRGNAIILPPGQLARPLYDAVNKVLTAMGGKWNRKAGGHLFAQDPRAILDEALGTGKAVNRQQTLQFFQTPEDLGERMAELAGIRAGDLALEPEAGHGRLVKPMLARGAEVVAVEIDPVNANVLSRIGGIEVHQDDFLEWAKRERRRFDKVVMNPPFTGNQDIRHVMAAFGLLREGGRLVAIMSEHGFIGQERECRDFRNWLSDNSAEVEQLPAGTFAKSGTGVSVRLITARKAASMRQAAE